MYFALKCITSGTLGKPQYQLLLAKMSVNYRWETVNTHPTIKPLTLVAKRFNYKPKGIINIIELWTPGRDINIIFIETYIQSQRI